MRINPKKVNNKKTFFSAYWVGGRRKYLNAENMSAELEFATTTLNYPSLKGITIDRVDTHAFRSGGIIHCRLCDTVIDICKNVWMDRGNF